MVRLVSKLQLSVTYASSETGDSALSDNIWVAGIARFGQNYCNGRFQMLLYVCFPCTLFLQGYVVAPCLGLAISSIFLFLAKCSKNALFTQYAIGLPGIFLKFSALARKKYFSIP